MENASPIGGENMSPSGRWVLKCPFHALWLDSVVEEFPDADFIVTHRPADQMVPSWAKFQAMTFRMLYDENSHSDSREVAKLTARAPKPGKGAELAKLADAVGETEAALHAFRLAERRRDSQRAVPVVCDREEGRRRRRKVGVNVGKRR